MSAGNTSNWTKVPANPYLNPADPLDCTTSPCVDLTANVIVGQWCNSDWTLGNDDGGKPFATNPAYCRTNGVVAAAASGAPAAIGDYMYPWLPSGVAPTVDSANYPNAISYIDSMVDTSTVNYKIPGPFTNATVRANWDSVKDPKYYFQNENVLWCDITSPEWPQTNTNPIPNSCDMTVITDAKRPVMLAGSSARGTMSDVAPPLVASITQTCIGYLGSGSCAGTSATGNCNYVAGTCNTGNGTCAGFTAGACNTGNGTCAGFTAGACNTANGTCAGFTAGACNTGNGTCAGVVAGTCNTANGNCNAVNGVCNVGNGNCAGFTAGACNTANGNCNGTAGVCNTASGNCAGFVAGACSGFSAGSCGTATSCSAAHEACNAGTAANCGGIAPQTCGGTTKLSCNAQAQTCQGALGAQTCANIVAIPPDPSTCVLTWIDPSGNPSPPSPFPCPNPDPEGQQCTLQNICPPPTYAGTCSKTGKVCAADADCPFISGTCSIQTTKTCNVNADCSGLNYCNGTTQVCATPGPNAPDCPNQANSGKCSVTNATCTVDTDCPGTGTCNYQNNGGINNGICFSTSDCKPFPNRCAITSATICPTPGANAAACPIVAGSGICTYGNGFTGGACTTTADCSNRCQNAGATVNTVCASNAACTDNGACSAGQPATTTCTIASDCNVNGACTTGTNTGATCTANGANATCGPIDKCSAGKPATTNCAINSDCNANGTCTTGTNTGAVCAGNGANAPAARSTSARRASQHDELHDRHGVQRRRHLHDRHQHRRGLHGNRRPGGLRPDRQVQRGLPNTTTCTTNAQCNTTGTCTSGANTGAVCTVNGVNAACGAINKCTVGQDRQRRAPPTPSAIRHRDLHDRHQHRDDLHGPRRERSLRRRRQVHGRTSRQRRLHDQCDVQHQWHLHDRHQHRRVLYRARRQRGLRRRSTNAPPGNLPRRAARPPHSAMSPAPARPAPTPASRAP